jgi:CRISPR-associated protein Csd1
MIHALLQYAQDRGLVSRPGYCKKKVKWVLDFDEKGKRFLGLVSSDREFNAAPELSFPQLIALTAMKGQAAHFLVAPLGTYSGVGKDLNPDDSERTRRATLCWMLSEAGKTEGSLSVLADALTKSENESVIRKAAVETKPKAKSTDLVTVRIGKRFPVDESFWHDWWDAFRASLKKDSDQHDMACFGTGDQVTPEKTHPKVKGLKGVGLSQPYAPIITFDKSAFESYGLEQAANAAMSAETATAYVNAIDHLLEHSVIYSWRRPKVKAPRELTAYGPKVGGARLAYWYTGPAEERRRFEAQDDLIALLLGSADRERMPPDDPDEERLLAEGRLRRALERVRTGESAQPVGNVRFCVLILSGAGGRVMVRDFFEGTILHLAESTDRWFSDLSLISYWGRSGESPGLEQILTTPLPARKPDQEYMKWVAPAGGWRQRLWRAALTGGQLPATAAVRALIAHNSLVVRGDLTDESEGLKAQRLSRLRLALIKAYLIRKGIPMKPALDPEHPSPAYHCGRLLAVYDSLQRAALGEVGTGVIQRYYGGALTNPSGVFGQLSRMAQTHLSKLEGGLLHIYQRRIADIHNGIGGTEQTPACYPTALGMDDQALFALGFWHQIAANNKDRAAAAAAKKARENSAQQTISPEEEN